MSRCRSRAARGALTAATSSARGTGREGEVVLVNDIPIKQEPEASQVLSDDSSSFFSLV